MTKETVTQAVFYSVILVVVVIPILIFWAFPYAVTSVTVQTIKWLLQGKKINWQIWD